ncbi:MAG: response regulator transcription factor [Acidobacteria bacterium]|nr:response regulator transcription factor [Acidobacteriota bacterium]MBI3489706.1 response regulator transcription factor [Acidobacteriota bacterium]
MKLRAALVDDEPLALERLGRMIEATGRAEIVSTATDPAEALEILRRIPVDVLFLDIHMPGLTGFDLLARLPSPPAVVFTTAHPEHALEAFRADSLDYLLKPVKPEHLEQALAKAERLRKGPAPLDVQALGRALSQALAASQRPGGESPARIAARLGARITFLDLRDIVYFHVQDKLTYAMTDGKAHCVDHTLADLEQRLDPRCFLRIHRAVLLNAAWVREVLSLPSGNLVLRLRDTRGTELEVPKGRAKEVRSGLGI